MGTSVNHPSPKTLPWDAVAAVYRNPEVSLDSVLRHVWRAARSEPDADVRQLLQSPGIMVCLAAAMRGHSRSATAGSVISELAQRQAGSVVAEVGRRAAILSSSETDRFPAFVGHLFGQMTDYLVSRDLPSYVGNRWRNKTVAEAIQFKDELRTRAREIVASLDLPEFSEERKAWHTLVNRVADRLVR